MADGNPENRCCCSPVVGALQETTEGMNPSVTTTETANCRNRPYVAGAISTLFGNVPRLSTALYLSDHLGALKMRLGIGRMQYQAPPGLYAIGNPQAGSPVFVTANYKLTLDRLRSEFNGISGWILILDTKGVNVWCAAGKGTFSTDEIVRQVSETHLAEIVQHRTLIVPQLGAPGVAAHQVKNRCGFRVVYGPVRARDIRAFLTAGMKATPEMRKVEFPLGHRLAVMPVDLPRYGKYILPTAFLLFFLAGLGADGYSWARTMQTGLISGLLLVITWLASTLLAPALLPWLPGRPFSMKGLWLGLGLLAVFIGGLGLTKGPFDSWLGMTSWCFLIPAVSSFLTMAFTGSTTYTSLSGVRYEMRRAVPIQTTATIVGLAAWVAGRFI
jgi:hypothetical protein